MPDDARTARIAALIAEAEALEAQAEAAFGARDATAAVEAYEEALVRREAARLLRAGPADRTIRSMNTPQAFWQAVAKGPTCWEWTGALSDHGYGRLKWMDSLAYAHRVSWELSKGRVPGGIFVCHRCDNPKCVRPEHLFLGTAKDNNRDRDDKGRGASALMRAVGRSRRKHPAQARLYQQGVTISELAKSLGETRARVSSWFAAGDANRPIPRHHAEALRDRYGIPLGDWSRIAD